MRWQAPSPSAAGGYYIRDERDTIAALNEVHLYNGTETEDDLLARQRLIPR